jgi:hypothetical protein
MASTGALYLTQSKYGIWYYQRWMPLYVRRTNPNLNKVFRVSLHTQSKQKASRLSRVLSVKIDNLALDFFDNSKDFGQAMELLYLSAKAWNDTRNYHDYEEVFFAGIEGFDDYLLSKAERFQDKYKAEFDKLQEEVSLLKEVLLNSKTLATPENKEELVAMIWNKTHPPYRTKKTPRLKHYSNAGNKLRKAQ